MDEKAFLSFNMYMDFHLRDEQDNQLAEDLQWFTKPFFDQERIVAVARRRALVHLLRQQMHKPSRELVLYFARQVTNSALTDGKQEKKYAEALSKAWCELKELDKSERRPLATDVVNVKLTAEYKGRRFTATLLLTETLERTGKNVVFKGVEMNYQDAADQATSIVSPFEPFVSGWNFWRFIDPDTIEELPLKRLLFDAETRKRVRSHKYRR